MGRQANKLKIRLAIIVIFSIFVIGVTGYMLIEDDNFLDAIYMTVITVSTVGFGEIHYLSAAGKLFTIFLIISSVSTVAFALSIIITHLVEGRVSHFFSGQILKHVKKMENHIIICGFGRNGQQVAHELKASNSPFVVIENNHEIILNYFKQNIEFVEGNSTNDDILEKANIKTAKSLISTLPNDADNLYVVLTARSLNPKLTIISRASDENSEKKLRMAGVDSVVMPEKVGGAHMATLVTKPDVIEFLEHLSIHGEDPTILEEIVCDSFSEKYLDKTIYDIQIRKKTGANIIGYRNPQGEYVINPLPDTKLKPHSKLFVLGTPEQIEKMKNIFRQ
ncbi:MAG: potassium channel protein [Bacteroidales bacterium]|nr:potassium channel protein [Bacteroidales bacterium]